MYIYIYIFFFSTIFIIQCHPLASMMYNNIYYIYSYGSIYIHSFNMYHPLMIASVLFVIRCMWSDQISVWRATPIL